MTDMQGKKKEIPTPEKLQEEKKQRQISERKNVGIRQIREAKKKKEV